MDVMNRDETLGFLSHHVKTNMPMTHLIRSVSRHA